MAQMAPTPGRPVVPVTPDVFSERTHALANRIVPVVLTVGPRLRRELHAALWAAFAGCAFGFLYSQASQHSVLRSVAMSLAVAAGFLVVNFYRYYTHEDAAGHRLR
jgi:hypothetical protein